MKLNNNENQINKISRLYLRVIEKKKPIHSNKIFNSCHKVIELIINFKLPEIKENED